MTIAPDVMVLEEELEELFGESVSTPCDCDHKSCSSLCKGHHLALPAVDAMRGVEYPAAPGNGVIPCPASAAWLIVLRGPVEDGYIIPPSPRYLCDQCKDYWVRFPLDSRVERL